MVSSRMTQAGGQYASDEDVEDWDDVYVQT
jgi:hypothetical protein